MHDMREMMSRLHRMGRYGGYGGLKTMVLYTLSEQPKNGVEIMDAIEKMSFGHWKPSPGSLYPLLKKAAEENLIRKRDDGRYELTPEGSAEIEVLRRTRGGRPRPRSTASSPRSTATSRTSRTCRAEAVAPHREQIARIVPRLAALVQRGRSVSGWTRG